MPLVVEQQLDEPNGKVLVTSLSGTVWFCLTLPGQARGRESFEGMRPVLICTGLERSNDCQHQARLELKHCWGGGETPNEATREILHYLVSLTHASLCYFKSGACLNKTKSALLLFVLKEPMKSKSIWDLSLCLLAMKLSVGLCTSLGWENDFFIEGYIDIFWQ